jgi:hypothetical protein
MRERTTGSGSVVVSVVRVMMVRIGVMVVMRRGMANERSELFREIHTGRGSGGGSVGGRITGSGRIGAKWIGMVWKEGYGSGVMVVVMRMMVMKGGKVKGGSRRSGRVGVVVGGAVVVVVVRGWVRQVETLLADGLERGGEEGHENTLWE